MSIKNERKRRYLFSLEILEGGIYYINPEAFGFQRIVAQHRCVFDNLYFERLRYLEIPQ
jgi:hypothetical protein